MYTPIAYDWGISCSAIKLGLNQVSMYKCKSMSLIYSGFEIKTVFMLNSAWLEIYPAHVLKKFILLKSAENEM